MNNFNIKQMLDDAYKEGYNDAMKKMGVITGDDAKRFYEQHPDLAELENKEVKK